jgi:hypothetical protein
MWDNHNRVLFETEHSVACDLQIQQITAEFDMGLVGLATNAKGPLSKRTTVSPLTAIGLFNGMANQNKSGSGTCRTT